MKSIRVKEETHRRLLRIMGLLQARDGKRKTVEDAVVFLLDEHEGNKELKTEDAQKQ